MAQSTTDGINDFIQQLHNEFSLKDMGDLRYFLGIEVTRSSTRSLHLCQRKYIRDLLDRSSLANAKSVHTLMVSSSTLSKDEGDRLDDPTEYRSLDGALQYVVLTRPDIAYAVNRACQFMHAPTTVHLVALKRILQYLHGTINHGLIFRSSDRLSLVGYADANWGLDFDDRRPTTGYYPPTVWCDNFSAVAVAANPVADGSLVVGEVLAYDQVADILTKPLSVSTFARFCSLLQVLPLVKLGEAGLEYC
ncbi:hypothetical protein EPI10_002227 [Gossypium australe]|uniref:Reverse transcriptase Ty1/copia-type domain-containing protein n=1 Tax=Gossypium australe TaxID=47621 RepID=A0A5B6VDI2_9ROSI|nr:hypothetical protein EPI10_002227 [Gossypium australe]